MKTLLKKLKKKFTRKWQWRNFRHHYFDEFVFIHINKTGGSSIRNALDIPQSHETALEKIEKIGFQEWNKRFSFTVIRNPWDKVVSHYHFWVERHKTDLGIRKIEFRDWVKLTYGDQDPLFYNKPKLFMPQFNWITDHNEQIIVDFICRFEDLHSDFNFVCNKLGKITTLPHLNASKHKNYKSYYDNKTIEIVEDWFTKDIENFGYRF